MDARILLPKFVSLRCLEYTSIAHTYIEIFTFTYTERNSNGFSVVLFIKLLNFRDESVETHI